MSTETNTTPVEAAQDFTSCPNWGKGGRYVVDLTNGRRVPVEELQADTSTDPAAPSDGDTSKSTKTVKESKRA